MSSPGKLVDEALSKANRAAGRLVLQVTKRKLLRKHLEAAKGELEEAVRLIEEALRASSNEG